MSTITTLGRSIFVLGLIGSNALFAPFANAAPASPGNSTVPTIQATDPTDDKLQKVVICPNGGCPIIVIEAPKPPQKPAPKPSS